MAYSNISLFCFLSSVKRCIFIWILQFSLLYSIEGIIQTAAKARQRLMYLLLINISIYIRVASVNFSQLQFFGFEPIDFHDSAVHDLIRTESLIWPNFQQKSHNFFQGIRNMVEPTNLFVDIDLQ